MGNRTRNVMAGALFASGVVWAAVLAGPLWRYSRHLGPYPSLCFALILGVGSVAVTRRQSVREAITRALFAIGAVWVGFLWTAWAIEYPPRDDIMALYAGVLLAPAYLLVAIRRGQGIGLRIFVASALTLLILEGITGPVRYFDFLAVYILLPPLAAIAAKAIIWRLKQPSAPGHCETCRYDLTGNISGVCPECGTAIKRS